MKYLPRIADIILQKKLQSKGAVLIEGPKWCGKTSTAMQASKSVLNFADMNVLEQARNLIEINQSALLLGNTPRLIDEWQEIPRMWDVIRNGSTSAKRWDNLSSRARLCLPTGQRYFTQGQAVIRF
jgi:predicted AAA+ superfamily ATPase